MIDAERQEFATIMAALCAAFNKELDEPTLQAYWMACEDMPLSDFRLGATRCMREMEYLPKPGHIRRSGGALTPESRCVLAFEVMSRAVSEQGAYASVCFDDPLINATIRNMGGWLEICNSPADKFNGLLRKDFERIYRALLESGIREESGRYLPGIHERDNVGYSPPVVAQIESGMPPAHKLLGGKSESNRAGYLGAAGESEEPEKNMQDEGRQAIHRLIKEGFTMEEGS